jgi:hypothetical protein
MKRKAHWAKTKPSHKREFGNLTSCEAWYQRSHYSPDWNGPFGLEHNEKVRLPWSKLGDLADINPHSDRVRINVAIFNDQFLQFETSTPTNLLPNLQRIGIHRFEICVVAHLNERKISETKYLFIDWRGPGKRHALVQLRPV